MLSHCHILRSIWINLTTLLESIVSISLINDTFLIAVLNRNTYFVKKAICNTLGQMYTKKRNGAEKHEFQREKDI